MEKIETPCLKLDDWIYTLGPEGSLYHQRPGSNDVKRIHHTHPPQHHKKVVKEWQDKMNSERGIFLSKRFQKERTMSEAVTGDLSNICKEKEETSKKEPLVKTEQNKTKTKQSKAGQPKTKQKTTNTLTESEVKPVFYPTSVAPFLLQGAKKVTKKKHSRGSSDRKCDMDCYPLVPKDIAEVTRNITIFQEISNCLFVPSKRVIQKYIECYEELTSSLRVLFNNNISIAQARRLCCEKLLFYDKDVEKMDMQQESILSKFGFLDPYYRSILDKKAGVLMCYCDAYILIENNENDDEKEPMFLKVNTFQMTEPLAEKANLNVYSTFFSQMLLFLQPNACVVIHLDSSQFSDLDNYTTIESALVQNLSKKKLDDTISFFLISVMYVKTKHIIPNVHVIPSMSELDLLNYKNVLILSFLNPSYFQVLPTQLSTSLLTCNGLTNSAFANDSIYTSFSF